MTATPTTASVAFALLWLRGPGTSPPWAIATVFSDDSLRFPITQVSALVQTTSEWLAYEANQAQIAAPFGFLDAKGLGAFSRILPDPWESWFAGLAYSLQFQQAWLRAHAEVMAAIWTGTRHGITSPWVLGSVSSPPPPPRARRAPHSQSRRKIKRPPSLVEKYLRVLGLRAGATLEEAKRHWRQLAKEHHPDKTADGDSARFKEVCEAWRYIEEHGTAEEGTRPQPKSTPR